MRLDSFLDESAIRTPDKVALVFGDRRLTYGEIDLACNRLAAGLREAGVRRGDRVAIYLENCPEAVIAIFAVLRADAAFMMVNPSTKEEKLNALVNDARASAIVTDARRLPFVARGAERTPSLHTVFATGISHARPSSTDGASSRSTPSSRTRPWGPRRRVTRSMSTWRRSSTPPAARGWRRGSC